MIAGIDGGGSHTRLELRDEDNKLLGRHFFGPFNYNAIGPQAYRQRLQEIFTVCGDMAKVTKICVGAAGVSNPQTGETLKEMLKNAGFAGKLQLCGDQEIALRGAMDGPGLILIAGTGSICYGKNALGETARAGGLGHLIDDGGSGYAIARDAIISAIRYLDGRPGSKALSELVCRELQCTTAKEITTYVHDTATDKARVAVLARPLVELAGQGDPDALEILRRGADELAVLVKAVQEKLGMTSPTVALLGSLIAEDNAYSRMLGSSLFGIAEPVCPNHDALWGAAQMAYEL